MSSPAQLILDDPHLNTSGIGSFKDSCVRYESIPVDVKDSSDTILMAPFQTLEMLPICYPHF